MHIYLGILPNLSAVRQVDYAVNAVLIVGQQTLNTMR